MDILKTISIICLSVFAAFGMFTFLYALCNAAKCAEEKRSMEKEEEAVNDIPDDFKERILNRLERLENQAISDNLKLKDIESALSSWGVLRDNPYKVNLTFTDNTGQK